MKDVFGKAILDYQNGNYTEDIITSTSISDDDVLPIPYLFRDYLEMPKIEQKALQLANGNILDVGCGAGSHSLYLQNKGLKVKSIDISKGAIETCKIRGLKNAHVLDILDETETFDTILMLMNGSGFFESLERTPHILNHLKSLLNKNGQILIDSSDIKYMYEDDDGGYWLDANSDYYGELEYHVTYKGETESFTWMYLDFSRLKTTCAIAGLHCDLVLEGEHYDFLARITL
ncbi:class I SAM-dependent methyltransferase [Pontimicrobium aquaticum]|uniref:Methyltransferase domain-containing protein n=1 Tax=Pontimicrobium aquaticum TaxID=2565367 RepID=A0A4U0EWT4_9FLAO|nr:methyltransferase domain-containing protein [Pontimicrobium aquaticum]TJY36393.1 methyltransferase domain-containing protein [Pontimicrobium aquaticum]